MAEVQTISFGAGSAFTALKFWKTRQAIYPKLAPVALDILAAPASQLGPLSRTILSLWIVVFRAQKSYDQITDCKSFFEDKYGHFAFTWCSVSLKKK